MSGLSGYFLVGPTAVGKSAVAQWIAEKYGYDILAADSMQVYKGMDIGTAKPDTAARARVRHHGIDLVDPSEFFNVWSYRRHAISILAENASANRKTIVVGGTGLYVKSLTDGLMSIPARDPSIRQYWVRFFEEKGITALQEALRSRNMEVYNKLADKKNARRLIRALEIVESGEKPANKTWKTGKKCVPVAGLMLPPEELKARIALRVDEMYSTGLVKEVKDILECGVALSGTAQQAIGYAEVIDLLSGRCSREDAIARTVVRTRQLAKRQGTWFRHQLNVKWIEITMAMETGEIAQKVLEHWRRYGPTQIAE
ncbi:MAG: tRNA (adenosine(37)-N6)-dimethylallyltransferase MiaA [Kiritimatiellae bacterium]|nr:tRNA (adenosine(37)-N6)-dimethylallyltransferase MiaA [Kiritimatiellia bacterium]MDD5522152.1 tRNA (adenosine(37)-N6)-dimethylallyltransferase MiaA [Kiritimatiellia bacterium]